MMSPSMSTALPSEAATNPPRHFSVDAALLRELGERLVGQPHIALAELVKNSYDADAKKVVIRFGRNKIVVQDTGHGMTSTMFDNFWLRIGTTHKQEESTSPEGRPLTGSKGVGRLAVQFLADHLELHTKAQNIERVLVAEINWNTAVSSGELQHAPVECHEQPTSPEILNGEAGTTIILTGLKHTWPPEKVRALANELWTLQSPFGHDNNSALKFEIQFISDDEELSIAFDEQYKAFLDLVWYARISGQLRQMQDGARLDVSLQFSGAEPIIESFEFGDVHIHDLQFEIRVYLTAQKQKRKIRSKAVREYLNQWGGVHVYDDGFRLPYYGQKENDWLGIERDHSHRLSTANLLPEHMRVEKALSFLPTTSRLFGAVYISTSRERHHAAARRQDELKRSVESAIRSQRPNPSSKTAASIGSALNVKRSERESAADVNPSGDTKAGSELLRERDHLTILVTRDRLVHNRAFEDLRKIVRTAIEFYANEEARRRFAETENRGSTVSQQAQSVLEVLEQYRPDIPTSVYQRLEEEVQATVSASKADEAAMMAHIGLLGALATAGISALAYEHEVSKQLRLLQLIAEKADRVGAENPAVGTFLKGLAADIRAWVDRARATRALFSNLTDQDNRELVDRLRARAVVESVRDQVGLLLRGIPIDASEIDDSLLLPTGRYAEWSALFQNVFFNACNAMLDTSPKWIRVSSRMRGNARSILVEDTGTGVDLARAEELFEPFVRRLKTSSRNRGLVIGGMGLGLTIVKLLANNLNCTVGFEKPRAKFKTAFVLSWSESK